MKEKIILGFDLSTTTLGYCCLSFEKKEVLDMGYVSFKENSLLERAVSLNKIIENFIEKYEIILFCIEESMLAFSSGLTNAAAMFKTTSINFLCQYLFHSKNIKVETINVLNARGLSYPSFHKYARSLKGQKQKDIIFTFVLNELGEDKFECYKKTMKSGKRKGEIVYLEEAKDVADSYVIAKAGKLKIA